MQQVAVTRATSEQMFEFIFVFVFCFIQGVFHRRSGRELPSCAVNDQLPLHDARARHHRHGQYMYPMHKVSPPSVCELNFTFHWETLNSGTCLDLMGLSWPDGLSSQQRTCGWTAQSYLSGVILRVSSCLCCPRASWPWQGRGELASHSLWTQKKIICISKKKKIMHSAAASSWGPGIRLQSPRTQDAKITSGHGADNRSPHT